MFHIVLHFIIPALVAVTFYREEIGRAWLIMMGTMIVDADHLLANPIYDPNRCSIGFHPLHTTPAIIVYWIMFFFPRTRLIGLGLLIHMALDWADCYIKFHF